MAKKRRLRSTGSSDSAGAKPKPSNSSQVQSGSPIRSKQAGANTRLFSLPMLAIAVMSAVVVYLAYHPSDSTQVESGDAIWFTGLALAITTITWALLGWRGPVRNAACSSISPTSLRPCDRIIDASAWLLAGWITVAALATSPPGNLRVATNEAWLWIAAAGFFTSARCWCALPSVSRGALALLLACSVGLAVHAVHQDWVSLPAERAKYLEDPEAALASIGIVAPPGSGQRMLVENRLFDGGPTATFALANSMAGAVLVGCVLAFGLMRTQWHRLRLSQRTFLAAIAVICTLGLLAARSRSALVALVVAVVAVWMLGRDQSLSVPEDTGDDENSTSGKIDHRSAVVGRSPVVFAGLVAGLLGVVSVALLIFGRKEWAEQAPASFAFRLQYWRATMRMGIEHPVFGAGPGNFKSQYVRYRAPGAGEAIADPHNFVFETIAAGGFVALSFLVVLVATVIWVALSRTLRDASVNEFDLRGNEGLQDRCRDVWWLGAIVGLVLVWLMGLMIGRTPDWQAHLFAVPIALATAWMVGKLSCNLSSLALRRISAIAASGLAIHLLAAGGWTIPGVGVFLWILVAIICRRPDGWIAKTQAGMSDLKTRKIWAGLGLAAGLSLMMVFRTVTLVPVLAAQSAVLSAESAQMVSSAESAIERAALADPWSADVALIRSEMLHWRLIERDLSSQRASWLQSIDDAIAVAGADSVAFRQLGHQALHLFQRYGEKSDLDLSGDLIARAIEFSPTDQSAIAQLAAIREAQDRGPESRELAAQAQKLAILGADVVRDLERQFILVAEPRPAEAKKGPIRRAASEVLANQLADQNVN